MKKADALKRWKDLPDSDPLGKMTPIPYKARGSRYGACGIRIDGNPAFIDAVLSKLKTLLDGENHYTRLELARNVVDGSGIGKALPNADTSTDGAPECCYVRLTFEDRTRPLCPLCLTSPSTALPGGSRNRFNRPSGITSNGIEVPPECRLHSIHTEGSP